jgi:alpha-L-fucosidase 2
MLLQSHANEVEVLPALPATWKEGTIKGICARGGFELDIAWVNGMLKSVRVVSKLGNPLVLRYHDKIIRRKTKKGKAYFFDGKLVQQ